MQQGHFNNIGLIEANMGGKEWIAKPREPVMSIKQQENFQDLLAKQWKQ